MSLRGFDFPVFFDIMNCAFSPRAPPLIMQPLIAGVKENTFPFLKAANWANSSALSVYTDFVEQQAPLLDTSFFGWFILSVLEKVGELRQKILSTKSDWGHDLIWCGAAREYQLVSIERAPRTLLGPSACALVVYGTPVTHLNLQSIALSLGKSVDLTLSYELSSLYESLFPAWFVENNGQWPTSNSFDDRPENYWFIILVLSFL